MAMEFIFIETIWYSIPEGKKINLPKGAVHLDVLPLEKSVRPSSYSSLLLILETVSG
jgi:hypothetical protein